MIANVQTSRGHLYSVPEWLDRLYELDPASLLTSVITRAVREFDIDLSQIHSDTTTITFCGNYDGNTSDVNTHIATWTTVSQIAVRNDFMHVADSKLCTRENMRFIHERGGLFVTVLPRSRQENGTFRSALQKLPAPWVEVRR